MRSGAGGSEATWASARAGRRGEKVGRLDQQPMKEKEEGARPEMREGEREE